MSFVTFRTAVGFDSGVLIPSRVRFLWEVQSLNSTPGYDGHSRTHATSKKILLCIDDRREILKIRKKKLESIGYAVVTATNAHGALAILEHLPVSAVLVEYKNEGLDSEAVAFQIKQKFPREPIILLSAYSDMPERALWLVDDYVMRSAPATAVAESIARVTDSAVSPEASAENKPGTQDSAA